MKNKTNYLILIIIFCSAIKVFAHEEHNKKDEKNDSFTQSVSVKAVTDSLVQEKKQEHLEIKTIDDFPNFHPLVVHFPIVLLIMAIVFQLLSFLFYKNEFSLVTFILLALGVISAWLASTIFHGHPVELAGKAREIFETHELMAEFTKWLSLIAFVLKLFSQFFLKRKWWIETIVTVLLLISTVTVSIAGHHGAMLVYMEGIGPLGKHLESHHK